MRAIDPQRPSRRHASRLFATSDPRAPLAPRHNCHLTLQTSAMMILLSRNSIGGNRLPNPSARSSCQAETGSRRIRGAIRAVRHGGWARYRLDGHLRHSPHRRPSARRHAEQHHRLRDLKSDLGGSRAPQDSDDGLVLADEYRRDHRRRRRGRSRNSTSSRAEGARCFARRLSLRPALARSSSWTKANCRRAWELIFLFLWK